MSLPQVKPVPLTKQLVSNVMTLAIAPLGSNTLPRYKRSTNSVTMMASMSEASHFIKKAMAQMILMHHSNISNIISNLA